MSKKIPIKNIINFHPELKEQDQNSFVERKAINLNVTNEPDGTIVTVASTPVADRDGDIVDPMGIKTELYTGTVIWGHDLGQPPIGTCVEHNATDKGLVAKIKFSDSYQFAVDIANLCKEKILKAVSIGFLPKKCLMAGTKAFDEYAKAKGYVTEGVKRIVAECELVEISLVNVGCNQQALLLAAKGFDNESIKNLKIEKEIEQMENIEKVVEPKEEEVVETPTETVEAPVIETTEEGESEVPGDAGTDDVVDEPIEEIKEETEEVVEEKVEESIEEAPEEKPVQYTVIRLGEKQLDADIMKKAFRVSKGLPV